MGRLVDQFDDVVHDEDGVWSNVCANCVDRLVIDDDLLSDNAVDMICGVRGCANDAYYHIDFGSGD